MKFLTFLHVPYEGPGLIPEWISLQNHHLEIVNAWEQPISHKPDDYDALIIMGGPMGVHDEHEYPWLIAEKQFISHAIIDGKKILGICLGSQLIAQTLGARVYKNGEAEIGWFPVRKKFFLHPWFPVFDENEQVTVFHWHGDTFDLPGGCIPLFSSDGCECQAFAMGKQILGLQFHPELNEELLYKLIEHGREELKPARYIQSEMRMISNFQLHGETSKILLYELLDSFFSE